MYYRTAPNCTASGTLKLATKINSTATNLYLTIDICCCTIDLCCKIKEPFAVPS